MRTVQYFHESAINYNPCLFVLLRNGTAFGGDIKDLDEGSCDFLEVKEKRLEFSNGETSKKVSLQVNMNSKVRLSWMFYHDRI